MQEIRCPKCGEIFQVDETGYEQIARQVRDKEFEKELTQSNWEFAKEKYITITNALNVYQEGAIQSNEEEYLNVNEYFDIIRIQDRCFKFLKNYL